MFVVNASDGILRRRTQETWPVTHVLLLWPPVLKSLELNSTTERPTPPPGLGLPLFATEANSSSSTRPLPPHTLPLAPRPSPPEVPKSPIVTGCRSSKPPQLLPPLGV